MNRLLIAFAALIVVIACGTAATVWAAEECPVEISLSQESFGRRGGASYVAFMAVKITAMTDTVTIQNIVVNRGNMELFITDARASHYFSELSTTLKLGEIGLYATPGAIREIEVQSDKGNWIFTFK